MDRKNPEQITSPKLQYNLIMIYLKRRPHLQSNNINWLLYTAVVFDLARWTGAHMHKFFPLCSVHLKICQYMHRCTWANLDNVCIYWPEMKIADQWPLSKFILSGIFICSLHFFVVQCFCFGKTETLDNKEMERTDENSKVVVNLQFISLLFS